VNLSPDSTAPTDRYMTAPQGSNLVVAMQALEDRVRQAGIESLTSRERRALDFGRSVIVIARYNSLQSLRRLADLLGRHRSVKENAS
jgi:hypothetical protein